MTRTTRPPPFADPVYVTRPLFPEIKTYVETLEGIWQRQWLTNGELKQKFEQAVRDYLHAPFVALTSSGTMALAVTCRALDLSGEVITTPLTSPATVHAITWRGCTPVFADIDPVRLTLDPASVERAVTRATSAILGVHIYGMPCDIDALAAIAKRHGLRLVYDGAHAFGTEIDGAPICRFGDATIFSFHATKLFNTAEGGAVATDDREIKERVELLANLGYRSEMEVVLPGLNARMNELQAALGLANLDIIEAEWRARSQIRAVYTARLSGLSGVTCFELPPRVRNSNHYFIIRLDRERCRLSRDELHEQLKTFNVMARRYFVPLCSDLPFYRDLASAKPENLAVAHTAVHEVLALPYYGTLGAEGAYHICDIVEFLVGS